MEKRHAIAEVGLVGVVNCTKLLGDITSVMLLNDVGGSSFLPPGRYRVRVTHGFEDYETGRRLHGELLDEKDVETARKAGTTGYSAEYYRRKYPKAPDLAEETAKAAKAFNPKKVYFGALDFTPTKG